MKKLFYIFILISVLFLPSYVNAQEDIVISDVSFLSQLGKASGFENPSFNGLNLVINGKFATVGDGASYKITFKNNSSDDYSFKLWDDYIAEHDTISGNWGVGYSTDHVSYGFSLDENYRGDEPYVVKANSTLDVYLTVTYNKRVFQNHLVNGKYNSDLNLSFDFVSKNNHSTQNATDNSNNPATGFNMIYLVGLIVGVCIISILVLSKKNKVGKIVSVVAVVLLPTLVFATSKTSFKITGNIEIEPGPEFCVYNIHSDFDGLNAIYYPYEEGMTWNTYFQSNPNNNLAVRLNYSDTDILPAHSDLNKAQFINAIGAPNHGECKSECGSYAPGLIQSFDEEIVNYLEGCYTYYDNNGG